MDRPGEIKSHHREDPEGEDLERDARHHDVDPHLIGGVVVWAGRAGYSAARGLQKEGDEVAGHEGDGVGSGLEPGERFAIDDDDARKT